ncbi:hypothetical protein [Telluribacter sp. SYSU D00476]|uniref:hypothetical protein n=1 Tax=Telluribacter sp. SYSU D00476 TaxID=2811430 RepID=UPI001FF135D8|nr:hypothetical protein [Telluribacter sp. SYSU D00476]
MKLHKNASLTLRQRRQVKDLYASGDYSQQALAERFGVHLLTIRKWLSRSELTDRSSAPLHKARAITAAFEDAVAAYRQNPATSHHGKVRIAYELQQQHACSNPSNVYLVLKKQGLNKPRKTKAPISAHLPVGRHRTQMDIQQLPAVKGGQGFEYKISIIHLSTRIKYSEIHDNCHSSTVAAVYQRALENLPPFSSPSPTTPCTSP